MAQNFYHGRLAEIVIGSANFASQIASDFAALGLTSAQSTAFGAANTALQSAWALSSVPDTRTPVAIEATQDAVTAMRALAIPLAKQLVGNPAVSDAQLVSLGLLPRTGRQPSVLITEMPVVTIKKQQGHSFYLLVRGTPRGKLPQALGAIVYSAVGASPPTDFDGWTCEGPITKDSTLVVLDSALPVGTKVYFAAQWFNPKGVGPGSTPLAAVIGAEGSLVA